jgi:heme/copper-type cytochrome/quinol oxidase subunit 2
MREELREYISLYYGPSAWESIVQIEAEQRRMQKEAVYRRQEKIDNLINWTVGILIVITGFVLFGAIIYFIGKYRGTW